jgi:hypothetical protein
MWGKQTNKQTNKTNKQTNKTNEQDKQDKQDEQDEPSVKGSTADRFGTTVHSRQNGSFAAAT